MKEKEKSKEKRLHMNILYDSNKYQQNLISMSEYQNFPYYSSFFFARFLLIENILHHNNLFIYIYTQISRSKTHMIYSGPINDPRFRFYRVPTQPVNSYIQNSPKNIDRFGKFKERPVNFSPINPSQQNLSHSNIYTKQGVLKRNDIGWEGVKLTQYVTEQLAQNYLQNQRIIQKFRKEAEENRKRLKYGHAYESRISPYHQPHDTLQKPTPYLPSLTPIVHQQNTSHAVYTNPQDYLDQEIQVQKHRYRNVGVNTNKVYERSQLQKYIKLRNRYDALKQKYQREKHMRKIQKRRFQEIEQARERQIQSIEKIKNIQTELMSISVKLETNNSMLAEQLSKVQGIKQQEFNKTNYTKKTYKTNRTQKSQRTEKRYKTQLAIQQQIDPQSEIKHIRKPSQILILKTSLKPQQLKYPTVVYTNKNDSLTDTKMLMKYQHI